MAAAISSSPYVIASGRRERSNLIIRTRHCEEIHSTIGERMAAAISSMGAVFHHRDCHITLCAPCSDVLGTRHCEEIHSTIGYWISAAISSSGIRHCEASHLTLGEWMAVAISSNGAVFHHRDCHVALWGSSKWRIRNTSLRGNTFDDRRLYFRGNLLSESRIPSSPECLSQIPNQKCALGQRPALSG